MTTNIDSAADIIGRYVHPDFAEDAARDLAAESYLMPDPQIIRTVEELEALDHDTLVTCGDDQEIADVGAILATCQLLGLRPALPAVVVAPAEQARAARKALEEA